MDNVGDETAMAEAVVSPGAAVDVAEFDVTEANVSERPIGSGLMLVACVDGIEVDELTAGVVTGSEEKILRLWLKQYWMSLLQVL